MEWLLFRIFVKLMASLTNNWMRDGFLRISGKRVKGTKRECSPENLWITQKSPTETVRAPFSHIGLRVMRVRKTDTHTMLCLCRWESWRRKPFLQFSLSSFAPCLFYPPTDDPLPFILHSFISPFSYGCSSFQGERPFLPFPNVPLTHVMRLGEQDDKNSFCCCIHCHFCRSQLLQTFFPSENMKPMLLSPFHKVNSIQFDFCTVDDDRNCSLYFQSSFFLHFLSFLFSIIAFVVVFSCLLLCVALSSSAPRRYVMFRWTLVFLFVELFFPLCVSQMNVWIIFHRENRGKNPSAPFTPFSMLSVSLCLTTRQELVMHCLCAFSPIWLE